MERARKGSTCFSWFLFWWWCCWWMWFLSFFGKPLNMGTSGCIGNGIYIIVLLIKTRNTFVTLADVAGWVSCLFVLALAAAQEIGRRDRAARRGGGTIDKDASECVYSRAQSQSPPTSFIRISCTNCLCCWCCCGWWWCYQKRIKENFSKDRSNAISKAVVLLFVLYW